MWNTLLTHPIWPQDSENDIINCSDQVPQNHNRTSDFNEGDRCSFLVSNWQSWPKSFHNYNHLFNVAMVTKVPSSEGSSYFNPKGLSLTWNPDPNSDLSQTLTVFFVHDHNQTLSHHRTNVFFSRGWQRLGQADDFILLINQRIGKKMFHIFKKLKTGGTDRQIDGFLRSPPPQYYKCLLSYTQSRSIEFSSLLSVWFLME